MSARLAPTIRIALSCALALAFGAASAAAQSKTGTTIGTFLEIEPSARVTGFGNAGVALGDGVDAAFYNPAAIGRLERPSAFFVHSTWLAGIAYDYGAGVLPLGKWGNGFASVTALNSGDMDVRTVAQPQGTGERFSVNDVAIGLGYGREVTSRFSVGFQFNYLQETIWNSSLGAMTMNVGTLYQLSDNGLHLGSSISNWGTQAGFSGRDLRIAFDADPSRFGDNGQLPATLFTDEFSLPVVFRVGIGARSQLNPQTRLLWEVDAFHPNDNNESLSAGAELLLRKALALRAGYQNAFLQDSELSWTLGAGVLGKLEEWDYRLDYAWADQGRLGGTHRVALAMLF
jgi:hypothetical protein